jgi:HD-like signal output (HDOD) protein
MSTINQTISDEANSLVTLLESLISSEQIEIPMLPSTAQKVLMMAQSADGDAAKMAKLIEGDQSLAGNVMRIANSAAYTPMANLVSLQQAVARLGMGVITEIALAASVGTKLFHTPGFESYVADIWQEALATALWAKEIARFRRSNVEVAFLAGLLHSIGRPAVIQVILELASKQKIALSDDDVILLEQRFAHQVTQSVMNTWQMSSLVTDAVVFYSDLDKAAANSTQAAHVNAGLLYAKNMLHGDEHTKQAIFTAPVLAALNLYQDEAESLLEQTDVIKGRLEGLAS